MYKKRKMYTDLTMTNGKLSRGDNHFVFLSFVFLFCFLLFLLLKQTTLESLLIIQ